MNKLLSAPVRLFSRLIEPPRDKIDPDKQLFSNGDLKKLIFPLIVEQILIMTVGMAGTMMVSYAGEAAMSGVSLSDMINVMFQYVFNALATGGTIVVAQYIGGKDTERGCRSAGQLVMITVLISLVFSAFIMVGNRPLLGMLYGSAEKDVMDAAVTYLMITALSYPFMAAYDAFSALFRAMGRSKINMKVSFGMNVINVIGNAIGVFWLGGGAGAVGLSALISRAAAAGVMFVLLRSGDNPITVRIKDVLTWNGEYLKRILSIAIPSGIESGLFQVCRVALTGMIATFGTAQIAANGVAVSLDSINILVNNALTSAAPAVIGMCIGAGEKMQAVYYGKKLLLIDQFGTVIMGVFATAALPMILSLYELSPEARDYTFTLVRLHLLWTIFLGPTSGTLPAIIRSAGDVRYTMLWSCISLVFGRVLFSYIFSMALDQGVVGMWLAMPFHWGMIGISSYLRFRGNKWLEKKVV